ncbi:MAG TPA: Asp-tRNA(Asn)/Glu-tRNA(Gln) amidotransferase subunit GatB [Patescibacteria group bacterium]|nr:Asp-tRNA(Asn)/Glu-tRNA(Gln) amidotransferase subunit GatB [Patescibacteria group bacterium]
MVKNKEYETVIGLEVHVELATKSKMFCSCSADWFGEKPNTHNCPVCMGLPGALPVPNGKAIEMCVKVGLALNCTVAKESKFDRKNYFYPDLPKGYQISQFDQPLSVKGYLPLLLDDGTVKRIGITRIHQEEDTGKLIHSVVDGKKVSLVDLNRSGVPLIEVVSEPDISSPQEAKLFLQQMRQIVRYLEVSDGDMEKGSLRCDANISLRPKGDKKLGTKVEIKNMNSFRSVERALESEIVRQTSLLNEEKKIVQETRGWDEDKAKTFSQRSKEESSDYRYFPEPDVPPMLLTEQQLTNIKKEIPELGFEKYTRLQKEYGLSKKFAAILTESRNMAQFYEDAVSVLMKASKGTKEQAGKDVANWIVTGVMKYLNETGASIRELLVEPAELIELILFVRDGTVSQTAGAQILDEMLRTDKSARYIIEEKGLQQISGTSELEGIVDKVIREHPEEVKKFKEGKTQVIGFLIGIGMKESKGKANPQVLKGLFDKKLK